MTAASLPGLRFAVAPPVREPSPLRSDVAGVIGRVRRGPIGRAIRVEGWREYRAYFGDLRADLDTTYAVRGYFENEGQVAHVVRVAGTAAARAFGTWSIGLLPASSGFASSGYIFRATSEGVWANETAIDITYRRDGLSGRPELDLVVTCAGEPIEIHNRIDPARVVDDFVSPLVTVEIIDLHLRSCRRRCRGHGARRGP